MGFPRQESWNELSFPSPGHLFDSEIEPTSAALAGRLFITEPTVSIWISPTEYSASTSQGTFVFFLLGCIYNNSGIKLFYNQPLLLMKSGHEAGKETVELETVCNAYTHCDGSMIGSHFEFCPNFFQASLVA